MDALNDLFTIYSIKHLLIWLILLQAIAVSLIFVILLSHKLLRERDESRHARLLAEYRGALVRWLADGQPVSPHPDSSVKFGALTKACIDHMAVCPHEATQIRALTAESGIVRFYQRKCGSTFWPMRFYAVEHLGLLGIRQLKRYFLSFLESEKVFAVRMRIVWALSLIADVELLGVVMEALATEAPVSSKFNEHLFVNIITTFREQGIVPSFVEYLDDSCNNSRISFKLKRDLIESCGSACLAEAGNAILAYEATFPGEVPMRIACIRAMGKIAAENPGAVTGRLILEGLSDDEWSVRAVAAGYADQCGPEALAPLERLLHDRVYHVRNNAAKTLRRMGEAGVQTLMAKATSEDRFVRDTVRYVLAR